MLDLIYKIIQTILSKDSQGYITPEEFNNIASLVQMEIFRGYFEDENRDKNKQNRGLSNEGYANLPFTQRQRITQFAATTNISILSGTYKLPTDLYLLEEDGVTLENGTVVEEVERKDLNYLVKSNLTTRLYPVYEKMQTSLKLYPTAIIDDITVRYLRVPRNPKWTYFVLPNNEVKFDPTNSSYTDFELHNSEFSNIAIRMMSYFGVTIREEEVVQIAESLKQQNKIDNEG